MEAERARRSVGAVRASKIAHAVAVAGAELSEGKERQEIWNRHFRDLTHTMQNYQLQDFEIVDYQIFSLPEIEWVFRGPKPNEAALAAGRYMCLVGAAQFFGRFQPESLQSHVAARFRMPVLNLALGGRGPQEYLRPAYRLYLERARLVVVQVLSGRSVGCDEYPGGKFTFRKGSNEPVMRTDLLSEIWREKPAEYERLVRKWAGNYCEHYRDLAAVLPGPKLLVWISERKPEDWSIEKGTRTGKIGRFPQLVTREMVEAIRPYFDGYVECAYTKQRVKFTSRVTGEPCPFMTYSGAPKWSSDYYPPASAHRRCFELLEPLIESALGEQGRAPAALGSKAAANDVSQG